MSLILRLLLKAAPLLLFLLLSRAARDLFRSYQAGQRAYDRPPPGGPGQGTAGPGRNYRRDPYSVLGRSPSAPDGEIKKRYRELLGKYHPDKFIGQDLDADFVELASKKFQEIQEAYEAIRSRRGF
jgi:DnaJ-domain-containing protein 1